MRPEAQDADGQVRRPRDHPRCRVVPPAVVDVAVVAHHVAQHRQHQCERVGRDLADPVVRRIRDPYAMAGRVVDVIVS